MASSRSLTEGPVSGALFRLAAPMVVGVTAVLSVSLVDTYFVGRLGTEALAALSFTFPVTFTLSSLSVGLGAGASSVLARVLGAQDESRAKRITTDSLVLSLLVVTIACTAGYFTIRPLFALLGAQGEVLDLIERYMRIWFVSMPFLVIPMVANAMIRAAGDGFWPSVVMVQAALINVILTPMFVFGWGPIPRMEIEGAAVSSLIARATTLLVSTYLIAIREKLLTLRPPSFEDAVDSWRAVLSVAIPAAAGNMVSPIAVGVVTAIVAQYGEQTVAAFGVGTRIEAFAAIPMLALSSAIGPVAGQNWGAELPHRSTRALRVSFVVCILWSAMLALTFFFFGESLAGLIASDETVRAEAATYLRVVSPSLWGYGLIIVAAATFNGIGHAERGFAYYVVRCVVFYVPAAAFASRLGGAFEIFLAIALSNALAGISVAAYALRWLRRRSHRHLQTEPLRS